MEGSCRFIGSDGLSGPWKESLLLVLRETGALESRGSFGHRWDGCDGWVWENNIKIFLPKVKEAATNRPLIVYFNLNPRTNHLPQEPSEHCARALHFTNLYNA